MHASWLVWPLFGALMLQGADRFESSNLLDRLHPRASAWRAEHRLIDLHQHIDSTPEHLARAVAILDLAGIGVGVNLSGGTVTSDSGKPSVFQQRKELADRLFPGRFLHYMNLDYGAWDHPDFADQAVAQIEEGHRLGAAGLKEFKRLGLYLRDQSGELIAIDDARLDPVWQRCGELSMPVSIHVADPVAFWLPYNQRNERWTELKDHPKWWFGDPKVFPPHEELLAALERVIVRHPGTTFVCVHFANNPEDLDWVEDQLDRHPNMMADLAARIPEIGRKNPERVRELFLKHQDRLLFATDFQVYDRLTLGSGGSGPPPTNDQAQDFFMKHWQWMETQDRDFEHMTPIQGDWTISGIDLPENVLRKIYFDNARELLSASLPPRLLQAHHLSEDFDLSGRLDHPAWERTPVTWLDQQSLSGEVRAEAATQVKALWSEHYLYVGFRAPFETLHVYDPPNMEGERIGLWERDVVEMFLGTEPEQAHRYKEFQVAPTGERLDLALELPHRDFSWYSGWLTAVHVDETKGQWTTEMKIPITAVADAPGAPRPGPGIRWPVNFYRMDTSRKGFMAWNPTRHGSFHRPERFGWLEFRE